MFIPSEVMGEYIYLGDGICEKEQTSSTTQKQNSRNLVRGNSRKDLQRVNSSALLREKSSNNFYKGNTSKNLSRNNSSNLLRNDSTNKLQRGDSSRNLVRQNTSSDFRRINSTSQLKRENSSLGLQRNNSDLNIKRGYSSTQLAKTKDHNRLSRQDTIKCISRGSSSNNLAQNTFQECIHWKKSLSRSNSQNAIQRQNSFANLERSSSSKQLMRGNSKRELIKRQSSFDLPPNGKFSRNPSKTEIVSEICTKGCALHGSSGAAETLPTSPLDPYQEQILTRTKSWISSSLGKNAGDKIDNSRLLKNVAKELISRDSFTNLYNNEFSLNHSPVDSIYSRFR